MTWKKSIILKIFLWTTFKIGYINGQDVSQCLNAVDTQTGDNQFLKEWNALYNAVPQEVSQAYNTLFLVRDYTKPYESGRNIPFNAIEEACHDMDSDICAVTTTVSFNKTSTVIQEISKPICFPQTCETFEVDILDPVPLRCRKEFGCEILERKVVCPTRGFYPNGRPGNCADDAVDVKTNDIIITEQNSLEGRMTTECMKPFYGGSSDWCSLHTINTINTSEKIPSTAHNVIVDYSSRVGNTFMKLIMKCNALGYSLCTVDKQVRLNDNIFYEKGKPLCVPNSCTGDSIDKLDPYPICTSPDCEVISRNVVCPALYATSGTTGTSCDYDTQRVLSDDAIPSAIKSLYSAINTECKGVISGEASTDCAVVVPIVAEIVVGETNLTNYTNFNSYENSCARVGGRPCQVNGRTRVEMIELESMLDVTTHFKEVPVCVPYECTDNIVKRAADKMVFNCMDSELCQVARFTYSCTILEPSPGPSLQPSSIPSEHPSMYHSVEPTDAPFAAPSIAPTDLLSPAPSIAPTGFLSLVPTNAPSEVLSLFPTMLYFTHVPSLSPSTESSNMPSFLPSNELTTIPSTIPSQTITESPTAIPSDTSKKNAKTETPTVSDISSGTTKKLKTFYKFMASIWLIMFIL